MNKKNMRDKIEEIVSWIKTVSPDDPSLGGASLLVPQNLAILEAKIATLCEEQLKGFVKYLDNGTDYIDFDNGEHNYVSMEFFIKGMQREMEKYLTKPIVSSSQEDL